VTATAEPQACAGNRLEHLPVSLLATVIAALRGEICVPE
jgi:hypothetical protein